jgi:Enolase
VLKKGISEGIANAVLIKINQIGTISETLEVIEYAKSNGYLPVVSTRSGETEDTTAVHLTIAANLGQFKLSAVRLGERTAKWNEGLRIEEFLGDGAIFQGGSIYDVLKYRNVGK